MEELAEQQQQQQQQQQQESPMQQPQAGQQSEDQDSKSGAEGGEPDWEVRPPLDAQPQCSEAGRTPRHVERCHGQSWPETRTPHMLTICLQQHLFSEAAEVPVWLPDMVEVHS